MPTGLDHTVKRTYLHLASCSKWLVELFHGRLRSNPVSHCRQLTLNISLRHWLPRLLTEIGVPGFLRKPICIYADNNGAIALASHPEFHVNTKHIAIRFHRLREEVAVGTVNLSRSDCRDGSKWTDEAPCKDHVQKICCTDRPWTLLHGHQGGYRGLLVYRSNTACVETGS